MKPLPWPWHWDPSPHGWRMDGSFGPLSAPLAARPEKPRPRKEPPPSGAAEVVAPPRAAEPTPEQRAAKALLSEAQAAEARRRFQPLIKAVGVK